MVFPPWDPERVRERLPVVLAAVGARRSGKSTAIMNLVYRQFDFFDLVIAFVGSAACCPVLESMMERHPQWDSRFFFSEWNQPLIDRLLDQQMKLKKSGVTRNVLILMDDVILSSKAADQLSHMCMRGRHFNVSVMMAAVSYTSISKRCRRSLDALLVFSCPMTGDRKILSWEYASNNQTADFGLKNLQENECVVFETARKQQKLYVWKAELLEPHHFTQSGALPVLASLRTAPSNEKAGEHRYETHRIGTVSSESHTQSSECEPASGSSEPTADVARDALPRSDPEGPQEESASSE